eukprot:1262549-Rhodomonas_salina.1
MYYQQRTTKLAGMGPMPIDPGPDLVCRMAAKSFAQARVSFDKDLNKGAHPVRTWPLQAAALIPVSACSSDADGAGGYSRGWRQWHG